VAVAHRWLAQPAAEDVLGQHRLLGARFAADLGGSRPIWDREMGDDIRRSPMCFEPGQERCYCGKFANPMREPVTTSESEQT